MSTLTAEAGSPVNITATGTVRIRDCILLGFFVNSTTAGTLVFRTGSQGTSSGTVQNGTITPAAGAYYNFPMICNNGLHVTVGGAIDVTFFVIEQTV
jgi:hypothetical protein